MVHREALKKVTGGKTVKVEAEIREGVLEWVLISGDFFAYPASLIEDLESELRGKEAQVETIKKVLKEFRVKGSLVGISFEDLEQLLIQVIS